VPEHAWDSLEQCEEVYQRMELASQTRLAKEPKRQHGTPDSVWQSQVGDLSQLPVLTVAGVVLVRHRVMR
jgi:hypothetical protein